MIAWLSVWLKEVIMAILLAVFVDLILPSSMMQKYVRVVLSLLILLTLMNPAIALFHIKESQIASLYENINPKQAIPENASLEAILHKGEQLKNKYEKDAELLVAQRIEDMIKQQIESAVPVGVDQVHVTMTDSNQGEAQINQVQVILKSKPKGKLSSSGLIQPIEQVKPVRIDIDIGTTPETSNLQTTRKKLKALSSEQEQERKKVSDLIQEEWKVSKGKLHVVYQDES